MSKTIALKPRLSEKTYAISENTNTYTFVVPAGTSKTEVARAVSNQYDVTVTNVRLASVPGKTYRSYRRRGRVTHKGFRSGLKKAYVTLKVGDKLPLFAAVEEASKPEEKK